MRKSRHELQRGNIMPTTNQKSTEYPCQNGAQSPLSQNSSENEKSSPESSEKQKEKPYSPGFYSEGHNNILNGGGSSLNGPLNGFLHDDSEITSSSHVDIGSQGETNALVNSTPVVNCNHCNKYLKPQQVNGVPNRKHSPKANRPKSMSWSRVVKHRRDRREQEKKAGSKSKREPYIYPELGSSSDDSCDCFSSPENGNLHKSGVGSSTESEGDEREYSEKNKSSNSKLNLPSRATEQVDFANHANGHHEQVQNVNFPPRFDDMPISAPLAVPEDSDGSSQNSGCDSNEKETETLTNENKLSSQNSNHENKTSDYEQGIIGKDMLEIEEQVEEVFTHASSSESLEEIADDDNSSEIQENRGGIVVEEVTVPSSSESLEEIGDYIETDFPSRASRHMFASSSEHSSTSSDEDEGYGVNQEKDSHDAEAENISSSLSRQICENGVKQENEIHSPLSCQNSKDFKKQDYSPDPVCDDLEVPHSDSFADVTANLRYDMESQSSNAFVCRPKYITKNSQDSSEKPGSDSSFMYSPEIDFLDSVDSDVPTSATSLQQMFRFSQDLDNPSVVDQRNAERNTPEFYMYDPLDYASNDLQGAEGGVTNDLSMRRHSFEFDDVECNMESYDPHLCVDDNEHFNYLDTYKHEKVPQANFQNSESNRKEKVFFKALEKENRSAAPCDSSDEEENLSFRLRREHLGNVQLGHFPQESGPCMVLEDLENPTHAVRNAVIMPLPNKLDESSG